MANNHDPTSYALLQTIPGVGRILALIMLYEIANIRRFDTVQDFVSYSRLVKCARESNGKKCGSGGAKIGNVHLKWAFSDAAVLFTKGNALAKRFLDRLIKKHGKSKALSILAHKLGRTVYFMLRNSEVFDQQKFLNTYLWRERASLCKYWDNRRTLSALIGGPFRSCHFPWLVGKVLLLNRTCCILGVVPIPRSLIRTA